MLQAIKLTFGSVWGWLGIIAGAVAFTNLTVIYIDFGVAPVVALVIETYRLWVYPTFDFLLGWTGLQLLDRVKDGLALYVVFASAVFRGEFQFRMKLSNLGTDRYKMIMSILGALIWPFALLVVGILFLAEWLFSLQGDGASMKSNLWLLVVNAIAVPLATLTFLLATAGQ